MKQLLFAASLVSMAFTASAQHITLHELFTGENCGPCAAYNPGLWALCEANPTKVINITFMTPIPTTGVFYQSQSSVCGGRRTYYNVNSAPHGKFDGNAAGTGTPTSTGFTQAHIDDEYAITSPFEITATHSYNATNDTVFGIVKIKALTATHSSRFKLRAAFTKTMHFVSAPGSNGEKDYPNVVRAMFTATTTYGGYNGQAIAANWNAGDEMVYTYTGGIGGLDDALSAVKPFTQVDSNFFVWVQNDTTSGASAKMVLAAGKSTYEVPPPAAVNHFNPAVTDLVVYPNPVSDFVHVDCTVEHGAQAVATITNAAGEVVALKKINVAGNRLSENFSVSKLSNGIYTISILSGGQSTTRKFVVSR
ncbi:MAG: T9SS type A sorting domain-containing protein [Taibaiella sp.]|nr:T9SS type A sorting domain-containing protein [Taibaiella sp.]